MAPFSAKRGSQAPLISRIRRGREIRRKLFDRRRPPFEPRHSLGKSVNQSSPAAGRDPDAPLQPGGDVCGGGNACGRGTARLTAYSITRGSAGTRLQRLDAGEPRGNAPDLVGCLNTRLAFSRNRLLGDAGVLGGARRQRFRAVSAPR